MPEYEGQHRPDDDWVSVIRDRTMTRYVGRHRRTVNSDSSLTT